jgi:hypothetical protein
MNRDDFKAVEVFRITRLKAPTTFEVPNGQNGELLGYTVDRFCVTDHWMGDLSNGLFQLGKLGEQLHGLANGEVGLLTLLRCYEPSDRVNILELLENASSSPSSFCFSTSIIAGPGDRQPLLCIGESSGFEENSAGTMFGIFVFPRLAAENSMAH